MRQSALLLLGLCCFVAWSIGCRSKCPSPANPVAVAGELVAKPAPQFELPDQFGTVHQFRFPRDKVTVVTVCGRKGSDAVESWVQPLHARFGDRVVIQGVADVGAAPGFMRGVIRAMFRKSVNYPVMLDWSGDHAAAFHYDHTTVSLYVVDRTGSIVHRADGPANADGLAETIAAIERQLR